MSSRIAILLAGNGLGLRALRRALQLGAACVARAGAVVRTAGGSLRLTTLAVVTAARLVRGSVITSKAVFVAIPILAAGFISIAAVTNPYLRTELDYAHERTSATEVLDADMRWLGIIPPASFSDWSDGSHQPADHAAIPLVDIPPTWATCITYLEDREFERMSRWFGIDPMAVLKSGVQTLAGDRRRGASTLYMQVVRSLYGRSPSEDEAAGQIVLRKLAEIFGAKALVGMLARADPKAGIRFVGMHLPLVIGSTHSAFGEPLHGIELASRTLFGVSAAALSPEQQAILAAAVKTPILLAPPDDRKARSRAEDRWRRVKERADFCLRHAFPDASAGIENARARLAALKLSEPQIDPDLRKLLPTDPRAAWAILVNPVRRLLYFAQQELGLLLDELPRDASKDWRGRVVSVQLTTSAAQSRPFADAVTRTLENIQGEVAGIEQSLVRTIAAGDVADVVVACADPAGRIRRIFESRAGLFWRRRSPVGSIAKMVAAAALGKKSGVETSYCVRRIGGIAASRNDSDTCEAGSTWLSARDAFARSNSAATRWALRHFSDDKELATIASDLRLPSFGDTPPATALSIGTFELTPARMTRLAATIGAGISGSPIDVHGPRIIERLIMIDEHGERETRAANDDHVVEGAAVLRIFTPRARSFVSTVLRATSEPRGTLERLAELRARLGGQLFAKTGTVSVLGATQNVHIAGTFLRDHKPWSFVVTVGTSRPSKPLGRRLAASRFAALAAHAICSLPTPPAPPVRMPTAQARRK